MSKRQRKLALGAVLACVCALAALGAISTWLFDSDAAVSSVHADEPYPEPTPAYDAEATRVAFINASTFAERMEVLKESGVKPWSPASANPPLTEPSALQLSPEDESAIEDVVSQLPEGKRAIAAGFLRRQLSQPLVNTQESVATTPTPRHQTKPASRRNPRANPIHQPDPGNRKKHRAHRSDRVRSAQHPAPSTIH